MSNEPLVYEMDDWGPDDRAALGHLLVQAGISHRWEGDDLLVPENEEERVDDLMDRVEFPDSLEAAEDDDGDDEAVYAVMSDLFVAADRLAGEAEMDVEDAGDFMTAAAAAVTTPAPYGVEPAAWSQVQQLAEGVVAAIEAEADDEVIGRDVSTLRDLLRRLV